MKKFYVRFKHFFINFRACNTKKTKFGIIMMILSSLFFSLNASIVKSLDDIPLIEIVFFRSLPTMVLLPIIIKKNRIFLLGNNKILILVRCFSGGLGMICFYYTFTVLLLSDAMILNQLVPFFVVVFSIIFLKEKITFRNILVLIFVLFGALLVIKPGFRFNQFPIIIAIIAAMSVAIGQITLRSMRYTENIFVIINYYAYTTGIVSLIVLIFTKSFIFPKNSDISLLIIMGIIGILGQITLNISYRMALASIVSLYWFFQIIFACTFGIIFFGEIPDILSMLGAVIIFISAYYNYKLRFS